MSPLTRSKPASPTSRETGAPEGDPEGPGEVREEPPAKDAAAPDKERSRRGPGPLEIELEVSRNRTAGWTVFGLLVGVLLVLKLGTVGVWSGFVLIAIGVYRAWQLAQT